jgi:predicted aspartyl protease
MVYGRAIIVTSLLAASAHAIETPAPGADATESVYATTTRLDRIGRILAPVMINGAGPYRLIVDTGANSSALSEQLVTRLGIAADPDDQIMVNGATGSALLPSVRVAQLRAGELLQTDLVLPILISDVAAGADGILGIEGLAGKRLEVDFVHDRVTVTNGRRRFDGRGYLKLEGEMRFGGLIVVDARVGNIRAKAVLDTGAERSVGNQRLLEALKRRARREPAAHEDTLIGATTDVMRGSSMYVPTVHVGEADLANLQVMFVELPMFALWDLDQTPALVLGMDLLGTVEEIVIDYRRSEIFIRPRSTRG